MNDAEQNHRTDVRLAALAAYGILDSEPEPAFDDIVLLATRICETPVALVSLVADTRQWFKARIGFDGCETPLSQSVCAHALIEDELLVIPDLTKDERTSENTLVKNDPLIRFYAGAVLKSPRGTPIGTLCVIDTKPRPEGLTQGQTESLLALSRQVMALMELRRAVTVRSDAIETAVTADAAFKQQQKLLKDELVHRLKNILAMVQAIVTQSFRMAADIDEVKATIIERIVALAKAQEILIAAPVEGADLATVLEGSIRIYDGERFSIRGADVQLGPKSALMFALATHELATNAVKYGALSTKNGKVDVDWTVQDDRIDFVWREAGGPPVEKPRRRGFGSVLIENVLATTVSGKAVVDFAPEGIEFRLSAPVSGLAA